jgi:hypothetical protein
MVVCRTFSLTGLAVFWIETLIEFVFTFVENNSKKVIYKMIDKFNAFSLSIFYIFKSEKGCMCDVRGIG